jgi:hypothetical protein
MNPTAISLIVDDEAAVNLIYWTHPDECHAALVPESFTRRFADVCGEYGVRGKFTVLPVPCGLGRIDQRLHRVPPSAVNGFLEMVRQWIAPRVRYHAGAADPQPGATATSGRMPARRCRRRSRN